MFAKLSTIFRINQYPYPEEEHLDKSSTEGQFICETAIALLKNGLMDNFGKKLLLVSRLGQITNTSFHMVIFPKQERSHVLFAVSFWSPHKSNSEGGDEFASLDPPCALKQILELPIWRSTANSLWNQWDQYEMEILNTRQFSKISNQLIDHKSFVFELEDRHRGYSIQYIYSREGMPMKVEDPGCVYRSDFWSSGLTKDTLSQTSSKAVSQTAAQAASPQTQELAVEATKLATTTSLPLQKPKPKIGLKSLADDDWVPAQPAKKASMPLPGKHPMEESAVWGNIPNTEQ